MQKARELLSEAGIICSVTDVIGVKVPDSPGGLSQVLTLLAEHSINVEYLYAFVSVSGSSAYLVLRVHDNDQAMEVLTQAGISLVAESDITAL